MFDLTHVERMVAAGMTQKDAAETAMWFMAQGDDDGLESYVVSLEALRHAEERNGVPLLQS